MNFIENRTREIAGMGLSGLYERQKAISANTVNVLTPGYQRRVVNFEDSLRNVIKREDEKEEFKKQRIMENNGDTKKMLRGMTPQELAFLSTEINKDFEIGVDVDNSDAIGLDGNNVNLEEEMVDEAQTGMKYQVLSNLLSKNYNLLGQIIKGQIS